MSWMPVRAYSSARDTRNQIRSGAAGSVAIAVMARIADEPVVAIEQPEIQPPGIDPESLQSVRGRRARRGRKPVLDLMNEPGEIPVEPVSQPDRIVRKAVDLGNGEQAAVEPANRHPAAGRAEVDRDDAHAAPCSAARPFNPIMPSIAAYPVLEVAGRATAGVGSGRLSRPLHSTICGHLINDLFPS